MVKAKAKEPGVLDIVLDVDDFTSVRTFHVQPGTHTIAIDKTLFKQYAIAEFLDDVSRRFPDKHDKTAKRMIALAVGMYDVPLRMLYEEDDITSMAQLDDETLAQIVRYRIERKEKADGGDS